MRRTALFLYLFVSFAECLFAQHENPRLEALKQYILEKDYPEVFKNNHYKTRIEGFVDADVDNDGTKEIVVLFHPHYRQSAPMLIYKVSPDLKVERVTEGLAPGPLQTISGDYLDSHALGTAVDFEVQSDKATPEEVLRVASRSGMSGLVAYDSFFHMDGRTGKPSYIDMRGVKLPSKRHDCGEFEFSQVKQIAVGGLREDQSKNYLAAWVGDEVYVYLISGVSTEGMLEKKLRIIKVPQGFKGFDSSGSLAYSTPSGSFVLTLK